MNVRTSLLLTAPQSGLRGGRKGLHSFERAVLGSNGENLYHCLSGWIAMRSSARRQMRRKLNIAVMKGPVEAKHVFSASLLTPIPTERIESRSEFQASVEDILRVMVQDWRPLAACGLATLISVGASVSVAPSLGNVIDVISRSGSTPKELLISVQILGVVYIISNVALAAQVALASDTAESLATRLRCRLFRALLDRGTEFHDVTKTGEMTAWLGQDIEVLQGTIARVLGARGLRAILETTGIILMLMWLSWPLAIALLMAAPLVTPVVRSATKSIKIKSKEAEQATSASAAAADEIVENIKAVRVFRAERIQFLRYVNLVDVAHSISKQVIRLQALLDVSGRARNTLCVLVTLALGSHLALSGRISIGVCYSFFVYSFSFAFALSNVTATLGEMSKAAGTVNRMMSVVRKCESIHEVNSSDSSETNGDRTGKSSRYGSIRNGSPTLNEDLSEQPFVNAESSLDECIGDIEFKNVSFSHPGGWTMDDISFYVPAGKALALVGPSGGGKSTIAALLLGLYRPTSGKILIDGKDIESLNVKWLRKNIGVVEQSPGLMNGRIGSIIRYGKADATDEDVEGALAAAQACDFIRELPDGYNTYIGPGGISTLSGGQRQRLALARALVKHPSILILDEATSALDVGTEAAVTEALENLPNSVTKIIIAHRLSTVRQADIIVVLSGGRVMESGTHEELISRDGFYSDMVMTGSGSFD